MKADREKRRILLVEDDEVDRLAVERVVREKSLPYDLVCATSPAEAARLMAGQVFDVVLLDYRLKGGTAFDLLAAPGGAAVIFVTGSGGERVAAEALRRGAYDYLIKDPANNYLDLLPATIENAMTRRRAEQALLESEARYQDLFDNAPDMYFLVDERGTVLTVNRQGALQLGYTVDELVGEPVSRVIHAADLEVVRQQLKVAFERPGEVRRLEFRKVAKDGRVMFVSERVSVQARADGVRTARVICRDITDQRRTENRERELQQRLARNERMESLVVLAGGVAHDLNNIIWPLLIYPEMLREKFPEGSREREDVLEIKKSAQRAANVIRDLLTLGRRGRYEMEPLDINDVVRSYLRTPSHEDLGRSYKEVEVRFEPCEKPRAILGSEDHLLKAVMNLVINAFEAMSHGGTLRIATASAHFDRAVEAYEVIPPGDYVVLRVSDTGVGIAEEDRGRVFEPFFTKKKMGRSGSGLGLSVVYGVVKDHHGFVDLESEMPQGTSFNLFFPVAPASVVRVPANGRLAGGTERILVVDDVEVQRALTVRALEAVGYRCAAVANGREAVRLVQDLAARQPPAPPFDLALMDMILDEDFDGLDTYRELLRLQPGLKCIVVSGFSETSRVRDALSLGAWQYLGKPFTQEALCRAVREELDRART